MNNKDVKAPCYKCTLRKPACHSTCEDYKEFQKKRQKILDAKYIEGEANCYFGNRNSNLCARRKQHEEA